MVNEFLLRFLLARRPKPRSPSRQACGGRLPSRWTQMTVALDLSIETRASALHSWSNEPTVKLKVGMPRNRARVPRTMPINLEDIERARASIASVAIRTPLLHSHALGRELGAEVYLKPEMLQRAGSFKLRGALNKIMNLPPPVQELGVIAASAGNHAQGVAMAAARLGIPAIVVMPTTAPHSKAEA